MYLVRKLFWGCAMGGALMLLGTMAGFFGEGIIDRIGFVLGGAGMLAGGGGTLLLASGKLAEGDVFPVQVIVRVGFMVVGPGAVLIDFPSLLEDMGWQFCLFGCVASVVPFGIALLVLLRRRRKERER